MKVKLVLAIAVAATVLAGCSTCLPPGRLDWVPYHNEWREKCPKYPVPNYSPDGSQSSKHLCLPRV
jgi:hypothetical protein